MMHHRAALISEAGVSALCFKKPRPIRLDRGESWVLIDANVDCPRCKKIIRNRLDPGVRSDPGKESHARQDWSDFVLPAPSPAPALDAAPDTHPRPGDVYHNDGIGEVTLAGRNKRNDGWTTNNPAVELMDSGFTSGHHRLAALRAEYGQALATERARSAGLTRALEEARGALGEIAGGLHVPKFCRMRDCTAAECIASRALTAIGVATGGAAVVEDSSLGEASGLTLDVPSGHAPAAVANPRETTVAAGVGSRQGAPVAGEAPSTRVPGEGETWEYTAATPSLRGVRIRLLARREFNDGWVIGDQHSEDDWEPDASFTDGTLRFVRPASATPVAQRRPAREVPTGERVVPIVLDPFVQALADRWWDYGEGDDHWGVLVGALSEMLAEADRRGEP